MPVRDYFIEIHMKKLVPSLLLSVCFFFSSNAQVPLKPRPDAYPSICERYDGKAIQMASSIDEMAGWDRYPTYDTYLVMMQRWAETFPELCHIDTIGTSVQGRLLLCAVIRGSSAYQNLHPEFFYTSTMHGDEVTGFVMMLRLIDTLLNGYGNNQQYTDLINQVDVYINPLSNPDGTYRNNNNTIQGCVRYNANWVDLNRNFPDPFGTDPLNSQQVETTAMIEYATNHSFRLSANLHGGSEVMNYPWDSFTSYENPHPDRDWWIEVCKRFVDTSRVYSSSHFRDVVNQGYIEGGDWYVIPNGRQDYMNYYHNCREMTMELSSVKTLSSDQLPEYWRFLQHSLVNYISEIHTIPMSNSIVDNQLEGKVRVYPNPARDMLFLQDEVTTGISVFNVQGKEVLHLPAGSRIVDVSSLPQGVYLLRAGTGNAKFVKR